MIVIASILALIFFFLGSVHFYWALFGIQNPKNVYPSHENGTQMKHTPGRFACSFVGTVLLGFAFLFLNRILQFFVFALEFYILLGIGVLFFLRGLGDFKYFGLFKKVQGTPFAKMDTKYYTPLCFCIAGMVFALQLLY